MQFQKKNTKKSGIKHKPRRSINAIVHDFNKKYDLDYHLPTVEIDVPNVSPRVSPVQTTQRYYYSGSSSKYLIMNAIWVSVDGQNRYMSVQSFGEAKTGVYPSIHVTDYTYSFLNTAQQVRISYTYDIYSC